MDKSNPNNLGGGVMFSPTNGDTGMYAKSPLLLNNDGTQRHFRGNDDGQEFGIGVHCWFVRRFKVLAIAQIIFGFFLILAGLYTHFPVFSGKSVHVTVGNDSADARLAVVDRGWELVPGEDLLWYGVWIGAINILVGIIGRVAAKRSVRRSVHIKLRRSYFIMNAFLLLYCNGIGICAYIISLSHTHSLIEPEEPRKFTFIMAFVCLFLLFPLLLLNLSAAIYQTLATRQCRCWICDPKSTSKRMAGA